MRAMMASDVFHIGGEVAIFNDSVAKYSGMLETLMYCDNYIKR